MIEIFLCNFDYYCGVFFFIINCVFVFDEVFFFCIFMILYYELKLVDWWKIWELVLNWVNMNDILEVFFVNWFC